MSMNQNMSDALIKALPKTDLHVHLGGCLRIDTLVDLAQQHGYKLPSNSLEGLRELVFKEDFDNLQEYLACFKHMNHAMQCPESLERVAYEFAVDSFNDGIRYFEVRFAPQLYINDRQDVTDIVAYVNRGLNRAKAEFNMKCGADEPSYEYGIILCAMRHVPFGVSPYFDTVLGMYKNMPVKKVFAMMAVELVYTALKARDIMGLPVVGIDIASTERGYPANMYKEAFDIATKNFLKKTVHAGEDYGPESIFQAITELHADRIGHGYSLFCNDMISDVSITDRKQYVDRLSQHIADARITLEVCLSSNMHTIKSIGSIKNHNLAKMLAHSMSVTICTDNRTISNTTINKEIRPMVDNFDVDVDRLRSIIVYGFKRSFFPGSYLKKRQYVAKVIDHLNKVIGDA